MELFVNNYFRWVNGKVQDTYVVRVVIGDTAWRLRWKHCNFMPKELMFDTAEQAQYAINMISTSREWICDENRVSVPLDWLAAELNRPVEWIGQLPLETQHELLLQVIARNSRPNDMSPEICAPKANMTEVGNEQEDSPNHSPFTSEVQKAWDALTAAHEAFVEIPKDQCHPHSATEWMTAVNAAQAVLEHIAFRQLYPHIFK